MFTGFTSGTQRVALAQAAIAPLVAIIGGAFAGLHAGLAGLYGALIAASVSLVLVWRERQSIQHPEWDQHRLFKLFIRAGIERLVLLVGLLFVGLGLLKLAPLPMMLGLLAAQLGWLAAINSRSKSGK